MSIIRLTSPQAGSLTGDKKLGAKGKAHGDDKKLGAKGKAHGDDKKLGAKGKAHGEEVLNSIGQRA